MKKLFLILITAGLLFQITAQVYDAVPQPTNWRVVAAGNDKGSASTGIFYKLPANENLGFVGRYTYVWNSYQYNLQFWVYGTVKPFSSGIFQDASMWLLPIVQYNKNKEWTGSLSYTFTNFKWQFNVTSGNFYNDGSIYGQKSTLQASLGYRIWDVIILPGYEFKANENFFINGRLYFENKAWLQCKYEFKTETRPEIFTLALFYHWDELISF